MMATNNNFKVNVNSETGKLEAVIIHTPGSEVENMTPENVERALYSDILNLSVARTEFSQLKGVLEKVSAVFEVQDLLKEVLKNEKVKAVLIDKVCTHCVDAHLKMTLESMHPDTLAKALIEGLNMTRNSLTKFLNPQRFSLRPLHNFFFTRDASIAIGNRVLISKMANQVREREAQIMEAIFDYHPIFDTSTFGARTNDREYEDISIEGGDVLVARHDLLLAGIGVRTTPQGIDLILEKMKGRKKPFHMLVQELPAGKESFIHLDMVFTFLSPDECLIFDPVVLQPNRFKTIHLMIDNGNVSIREEKNLLESIRDLGIELKPIFCGGKNDPWTQEREQWHSGANYFAIGPGKVIGYGRNVRTTEELNKNGYEVVKASEVIEGKADLEKIKKCVITIEGSELARGGGGARCMTMPVRRKDVER